jgi:CRP/FNR family transcriptional regulator, nitrogen oxide reductase regulator
MLNAQPIVPTLSLRVRPSALEATIRPGADSRCVETSPLFADIPRVDQAKILSSALPRKFTRRHTIFHAGDLNREVLLLTEGCVKITQLGENGSEIILRLNSPGELVGAVGELRQGGHTSTAEALVPCKAVVWNIAGFEALSERYPLLQRNTMRILARRLQELEGRFLEISTERVAPRLARELLRLLAHVGRKVDDVVEIHLSREELAQLTGTTLFTVSRLLSSWEQGGILSLRRQAVCVKSPFGLLGLCGLR